MQEKLPFPLIEVYPKTLQGAEMLGVNSGTPDVEWFKYEERFKEGLVQSSITAKNFINTRELL